MFKKDFKFSSFLRMRHGVLTIVLLFGLHSCSHRRNEHWIATLNKEETPILEAKTYPGLALLDVEVCNTCMTISEVRRYETERGSKPLQLNTLEIEKAFKLKNAGWSDSTGHFIYRNHVFQEFSSSHYNFSVYLRPKSHSEQHWVGLLYATFKSMDLGKWDGDSTSSGYVQAKYFFFDPILDNYLETTQSQQFTPDTNFVWNLFDTLARKIDAIVPPVPVTQEEYNVQINHNFWGSRGIMAEGNLCDAPKGSEGKFMYSNHYFCHYFGGDSALIFSNRRRKLSVELCLGWATTEEYYDGSMENGRGNGTGCYDVRPYDLAIWANWW